jgi:hypothetical protein
MRKSLSQLRADPDPDSTTGTYYLLLYYLQEIVKELNHQVRKWGLDVRYSEYFTIFFEALDFEP